MEANASKEINKISQNIYLRRAVVANVAEVGYSAGSSLAVALGPSAADLVARGPHHLGVVSDFGEVFGIQLLAVAEQPLLGKPRLYGEEPANNTDHESFKHRLDQSQLKSIAFQPIKSKGTRDVCPAHPGDSRFPVMLIPAHT